MAIDVRAFERYRRSPNDKTTLPRLIAGAIVIALCWFAVTIAVVFAGAYGWVLSGAEGALTFEEGSALDRFLGTSGGIFAMLATFGGIWLGIWIAMRFLHREKLRRLFGNSARLSRSGFLNGFGRHSPRLPRCLLKHFGRNCPAKTQTNWWRRCCVRQPK